MFYKCQGGQLLLEEQLTSLSTINCDHKHVRNYDSLRLLQQV